MAIEFENIAVGAAITHKKGSSYIILALGKMRDELTGEWKDAVRYSALGGGFDEYYRTVADVQANFTLRGAK